MRRSILRLLFVDTVSSLASIDFRYGRVAGRSGCQRLAERV